MAYSNEISMMEALIRRESVPIRRHEPFDFLLVSKEDFVLQFTCLRAEEQLETHRPETRFLRIPSGVLTSSVNFLGINL